MDKVLQVQILREAVYISHSLKQPVLEKENSDLKWLYSV